MRVAFYSGTMGGAGHLARALSIRRGLVRQGIDAELTIFAPPLPYVHVEAGAYVPFELTDAELNDPILARNSALARALLRYRPDLLLIDHLWFNIRHILPLLRCESWLLVHTVPAGWLEGPVLARTSAATLCDRIIAIEPLRYHAITDTLPPVLMCNPDDALPDDALKRRLGVPVGQHLTLVAHTGAPGEVEDLVAETPPEPGGVLVPLTARQEEPIFPLAPWLRGADRLIGGAGYHFFWETAWFGVRDRTHMRAFYRTFDDQAWRLSALSDLPMKANGADVLARQIGMGARERRPL